MIKDLAAHHRLRRLSPILWLDRLSTRQSQEIFFAFGKEVSLVGDTGSLSCLKTTQSSIEVSTRDYKRGRASQRTLGALIAPIPESEVSM
jgi:hypothetical protein